MVKSVSGKTTSGNFNIQIKMPKKESGLEKLFHSIVNALGIESWFEKEPISKRKIEVLPKEANDDEIELNDLFGSALEEQEIQKPPQLVINQTAVQNEIKTPSAEQQIKNLGDEIDVLKKRSEDLEQLIFEAEASDPWGLKGMVGRVVGKDTLSDLKEDKKIIDDLIAAKQRKLRELFSAERGDLDGLELEEHSDDEINL
jgi:hypothetical protein